MDPLHIKSKSGHPTLIGNFEIAEIVATPILFDQKPEEATLGGQLVQTSEHWKLFHFLDSEIMLQFQTERHYDNMVWDVVKENELIGVLRKSLKKRDLYLFWSFDKPILLPVPIHLDNLDCGKVAYATFKMALKTLKDIRNRAERLKQPIRAYKCHKCGLYHLTSTESLF